MKLERAAAQLEALGNPTRLAIYRVLIEAGRTGSPVGDVRERIGIPGSTLSHHISKLVRAGLVVQERESRTLYCKANFKTMDNLLAFLLHNCCAADSRARELKRALK